MSSIPESWRKYEREVNRVGAPAGWDLLRKWTYSEVWRVTFEDGKTAIAKIGTGHPAREGAVYLDLVSPLDIPQPRIYHSVKHGGSGVIMMEDLKGETLEQVPSENGYLQAARQLAEIRKEAAKRLGTLLNESSYTVTPEDTLQTLSSISRHPFLNEQQKEVLSEGLKVIPVHLEKLYRDYPVTLCHSDYYPKNLIIQGKDVIPVDWASAYLSPDLGDLYCLLLCAEGANVDREAVLKAFTSRLEGSLFVDLDWQITLGGVLWTTRMLDWTLRYGIDAMPIAKEWVPEMVSDLAELTGKIPNNP
ncbi:hypothetical protein CR205_12380 [Alteribacter lacisalsi]|uniref:Aminoglycoside phosphotransferase domain-containing protein n=1 Tax=Alteribacter lacisalsi TaxID=2045244 RepID=A0A2W0HSE4_9BACI|nr:phosphotransferase [Alteribacter lacisalsi]PYZ96508.1 hypothetical protein CR205_12380 [Alteribacter lacisalsi]